MGVLFSLTGLIQQAFSQDSQISWMNWYSDGSFASRDKLVKAGKAISGNYYVAGQLENDISQIEVALYAYSPDGELRWNRTYSSKDGLNTHYRLADMYIDEEENIYLLCRRFTTYPDSWYYVLKYDRNGTLLFHRSLNYFPYHDLEQITADKDGNTYIRRVYENPVIKLDEFGRYCWEQAVGMDHIKRIISGPNNRILVLGNLVNEGMMISRLDSSGAILDEFYYSCDSLSGIEKIVDTEFDSDHNLYVLSTIFTDGHRRNDNWDVMLSKIDPGGSLCWQHSYDGGYNRYDEAFEMVLYQDSLIYLGGHSMNDSELLDLFMVQFDSSGLVLDTLIYDNESGQSDYLFSFDVDAGNNKFLAATSFVSDYQFYSQVIKLGEDNQVIWNKPLEQSLMNRVYLEKAFLVSNESELVVLGNQRSTTNPLITWDTNSDFWITRVDQEGNESGNQIIGAGGASQISDSHYTLDTWKNSYVSGKISYGPTFWNGESHYIHDYFLQKIDSLGNELWRVLVDKPGYTEFDYLGHFMTSDTTVAVIGNLWKEELRFSLIHTYNHKGELLDSITIENHSQYITNANAGPDGSVYTYERVNGGTANAVIRKFGAELDLEWEYPVQEFTTPTVCSLVDKDQNLLVTNGDKLIVVNQNGERIHYSLVSCDIASQMEFDQAGNLFILGRSGTSGTILKLDSGYNEIWRKEFHGFSGDGLILNVHGDVLVYGRTCSVISCSNNRVMLMDEDAGNVRLVGLDSRIYGGLADPNGIFYLNGGNSIMQLDMNLSVTSYLTYSNDSVSMGLTMTNMAIDQDGFVYGSGTAGSTVEINYSLWYPAITIKFDTRNSIPEFSSFHKQISIQEGDSLDLKYEAFDPDNEEITYKALSLPSFMTFDSISGTLTGSISEHPPKDMQFHIRATDTHGAYTQKRVDLRVGNSPPLIDSIPAQTVLVNDQLVITPRIHDPELDQMSLHVEPSFSWLLDDWMAESIVAVPETSDRGEYDVNIWVTDSYGGSNMTPVRIIVFDPNYIEDTTETDPGADTTIIDPVGIHLIQVQDAPVIYPNPFANVFHIAFPDAYSDKIEVTIYDISGTSLWKQQVYLSDNRWTSPDLSVLPPGIYALVIVAENKFHRYKLINNP